MKSSFSLLGRTKIICFILREKKKMKEDNANKLRTLKGARNSRCPWRLGKQLWFRRFFSLLRR